MFEDGIIWKTRFTNTVLLADRLWPNDTEITLHLTPRNNDAESQNITFEKYRYTFVKILQNSVFITTNKNDYRTFFKYTKSLIDFPVKPIDQIVGVCLFAKLNSIGGETLRVNAIDIESWQGENLKFIITKDSPEWEFVPKTHEQYFWWNDAEPNFTNIGKDRLTWPEIGFKISDVKSHLTVIQGNKK